MIKRIFPLSLMALGLLQGCGGSDGGSDSGQRIISGSVFASGPLERSSVTVTTLDGAGKTVVAETTTSNSGRWTVELPSELDGAVLIEVSGGAYQELVGGETVSLEDSQSLKAITWLSAGESGTVNVSPLSTLAEALYHYRRSISDPSDEAIAYGNSQVSNFAGFNILDTTPSEATALNDSSRFHHMLVGLSSVSEWVATVNGGSPGRTIELTDQAYADLKIDGRLNGREPGGELYLGSVAMGADIYRHALALNIIESGTVSPLSFSERESYARTINDSELIEFSQDDVNPLDLLTPILFNLSHSEGRVIAGNTALSLSVASQAGLAGCDLLVDGGFYATTQGDLNPEYSIETELLADGAHSFTVECTDVTGSSAEKTVNLVVANAGTEISSIQPSDWQTIGGNFTFSANVTDPAGIQSVRFDVNGVSYFPSSLSSPSVAIDTSQFSDQGETYSLGITVVNQVGDTTTETVTFDLDNVAPSAEWNLDSTEVGSGSLSVTGEFDDNAGIAEATLYVEGDQVEALGSSPFSAAIDTSNYADGNYLVTLDVVDQTGNSTTLSRELFFDNTPPEVRLSNPWEGDVITTSFNIVAFIEDHEQIEGPVVFLVDGAQYSQASPDSRVSTELNVNNYSNNANHTIGVSVTDRAGFTTVESVTVFFDY